jgi:hypothetical protein
MRIEAAIDIAILSIVSDLLIHLYEFVALYKNVLAVG